MKVYHGSHIAIENIDFSFCRKRRDFGRGFYVTGILSQAEYWANRKGEDNDTEGVVTEFEFDESFFEDECMNVLRFSGYTENWLDFIVKNRTNKSNRQAHDCDMIEGPVADDDIAKRVYDYINGGVAKSKFIEELKFRNVTHQICFCTMRSLQALTQNRYRADAKIIETDKQMIKQLIADSFFSEYDATDKYYSSNTYHQLSDETTKLYQKPWPEIYEMLQSELKK
jgi:hypothetical protein